MKIEKKTPLQGLCNVVDFDIHRIVFDRDGVKDFYWPLKRSEASRFGVNLVAAYARIMRSSNLDADAILPYKIMGKYFVPEAVGLFQGDLLRERLLADNKAPNIPDSWRLWPALMEKKSPPEFPPYMKALKEGPARVRYSKKILAPDFFKKILKRLKPGKGGGVYIDGLRIKAITSNDLKNSIIATQRTELISAHAKTIQNEIIFCRSDKWFHSLSNDDLNDSRQKNIPAVQAAIMQLVGSLYEEGGIRLETHAYKHLDTLLSEGAAMIRAHLECLRKSENTLPRHIWTGSGGNVWDLMLRIVSRERGAYVQAHDHGGGVGYLKGTVVPFIELWACDVFNTYSESQAAVIRSDIGSNPILDDDVPEIKVVTIPVERRIKEQFLNFYPIKKVIFMGTIYGGDRARPIMDASDVAVIDWQYRMISYLKSAGYDVVLKHHPDGSVLPPRIFEEELGAKIDYRPFEEMMMEGDLFIFDYTATSTFKSALMSNIPILLIDLEDFEWEPEALKLVEQRIVHIKGWFDSDNRAQIDWAHLNDDIKKSVLKCNDTAFIDRYYA